MEEVLVEVEEVSAVESELLCRGSLKEAERLGSQPYNKKQHEQEEKHKVRFR